MPQFFADGVGPLRAGGSFDVDRDDAPVAWDATHDFLQPSEVRPAVSVVE
jgi:hypothetical protein